jgi:ribosomal protein S21
MGVKVFPHDGEPISKLLLRLRRQLERHGVTQELRFRRYYEKPSVKRRRKRHHDWIFYRMEIGAAEFPSRCDSH